MYMKDVPEVLARMFHQRITVELEGPPGVGKTDAISQTRDRLEAQLGEPVGLLTNILSTMDAVDVRGFLMPTKDGSGNMEAQFTLPPLFPRASMFPDGKIPRHGIIFLDERRQADPSVQKTLGPLLLDGVIGEYSLRDIVPDAHWVVWSASNRMSDRSGTHKDMAFLKNRICFLSVQPHLDSWVQWAHRTGVMPLFVAFAMRNPGEVFQSSVPDHDEPFCTPRSLVMASEIANDECLGLNHPALTEAIAGAIGEGTAAQLVNFAKVADVVPEIDVIVKDPEGADVPGADRPDAQHYAMQLCIFHADPDNADKLLTYVQRLPAEFQMPTVQGILRAAPQVVENKAFSEWLVQNHKVVNQTLQAL